MTTVLIVWVTTDGEEHEEQWPSVERFRIWAQAQDQRSTYTAYQDDGDGDWVVVDRGRV